MNNGFKGVYQKCYTLKRRSYFDDHKTLFPFTFRLNRAPSISAA